MTLAPLLLALCAAAPLDDAEAALADLRYEEAAALFEQALAGGPYSHAQVVTLWRDVGIVRAYLGDEQGARAAFAALLRAEPAFVLPYTTSPKASLLFDEERKQALAKDLRTRIELTLPATLDEGAPVALSVVIRDNPQSLARLRLFVRRGGEREYRLIDVDMPPLRQRTVIVLEPTSGPGSVELEVAVSGFSARGWEEYVGPTPEQPQVVSTTIMALTPWYLEWWVWAGLGALGVAGTGAATTALLWPRPTTSPVGVQVTR